MCGTAFVTYGSADQVERDVSATVTCDVLPGTACLMGQPAVAGFRACVLGSLQRPSAQNMDEHTS